MADEVQKELSFPVIPESVDTEMKEYLQRMHEIIQDISLGASYLSAVTLHEFSTDGDGFKDEDGMESDSAVAAPSQQSVKAYVDAQVATLEAQDTTLEDLIADLIASEVTLSAYTIKDSEDNTMLKAHAYLAATDGFVTAVLPVWADQQVIKVYVGSTNDPAGAGYIMDGAVGVPGTNIKYMGVGSIPVKEGEYFEITYSGSQNPIIRWKSMGTLVNPVDQN